MKPWSHSLAVFSLVAVAAVLILPFDEGHNFLRFHGDTTDKRVTHALLVKTVSWACNPEMIGWQRLFSPRLLEGLPIRAARFCIHTDIPLISQ